MPRAGRDLTACAAGYLLGSIPVGLLLGRMLRGLDIRDGGSGSIGSTNVLRSIGPGAAAATAVLDVAKGSLAVLLARRLGAGRAVQAASGVAAITGHCWPLLARFRGGKGVATAWGGLLPLSRPAAALALTGFGGGFALSRRVSAGSLTAAAAAVIGGARESRRSRSWVPLAYALAAAGLVTLRHADNIRRLSRGEEPRIALRGRVSAPPEEVARSVSAS